MVKTRGGGGLNVMEYLENNNEKPQVIILEDDESIFELLESMVSQISWVETIIVKTAQEFWFKYIHGKTAGILLDLSIQGKIEYGIDIAKKLRELDKEIFIFVITGCPDNIFNKDLLDSGVDDFLCKPLDLKELRAKLFLMFSRLRRWESMRRRYDVDTRNYDDRLNQLKCLVKSIKEKAEGENFNGGNINQNESLDNVRRNC